MAELQDTSKFNKPFFLFFIMLKSKLFYILLIILPLYGITISSIYHMVNSEVYDSPIFFLNFMVENTIIPFLVTTFFGLGDYPSIYIILANLLFWVPLVIIGKLISKTKRTSTHTNN